MYTPSFSPLYQLENVHCCNHCGAKKFQHEPLSFCCQTGQVKLTTTSIPKQLYQRFASQIEETIEFRKNIRSYNSMFSFTSFGVSLNKDLPSLR